MNRTTRMVCRLLMTAAAVVPVLGIAQTTSPDVAWKAAGLSTSNLRADYSPNGSYLLIQTSSGQYQVWNPSTQTLLWSRTGTSGGAAFSADSAYVLIPGPAGVVRCDAATGATVDSLAAPSLSGTPTAASQYGSYLALATSSTVFVYDYPAMTLVTSYAHTADTTSLMTMTGPTGSPALIIGNDATAGSGGARVYTATSGTLLGTTQGYPAAIRPDSTLANVKVYGMSGGLTNGTKHLYATSLSAFGSSELSNYFSGGNGTYNNFAFAGAVDRSNSVIAIPTRNSGQTLQNVQFINPATGAVNFTRSLGLTFSSVTGGAAVRFSPSTNSFVLYGTNAGTNAFAYYYTYDPTTWTVSAPTPLIGGAVSSILDGHLPSSAIAHGTVSGTPVTIDVTSSTNSSGTFFRRSSADGTGATSYAVTAGSQGGFAGLAVSPDGSRFAVAGTSSVGIYTLATGALIRSYATTASGVAFIDNNTIYTGIYKVPTSGVITNAGVQSSGPVASPSGTAVLGRMVGDSTTLQIINQALNSAVTKTFPSAPTAYGFVGDSTVWVSYSTFTSSTISVVTEFYNLTWGSAAGQTNRSTSFTRSGDVPESYGSVVAPSGKWIAAWYTGRKAPATGGGNGTVYPADGQVRILSGKSGAVRLTDMYMNIGDASITAASFSADSKRFEYSTSAGTLLSAYLPTWVNSVSMSVASLRGGNSLTSTVTLDEPNGSAALSIPFTLTSNLRFSGFQTGNFTVAPGATTAQVTLDTLGVAANSTETIQTSFKGETSSASTTLMKAVIASLTLNPTTVTGGSSSTGTVTLDGKAPSTGPYTVTLSSNKASATVAASFDIPASGTSGQFTINTSAISADTVASITASGNSTSSSQDLTILAPVVNSFTLGKSSLIGGNVLRGTVVLSGPAPTGGLTLTITSGTTSAVPSTTLTIPAGSSTYSFNLTTLPVAASVPNVSLTAKVLTTQQVATVTVNRPDLVSFTLNSKRVIGGTNITGTLILSGPAPSGLPVNVQFSNANASIAAPFSFTSGAVSMKFTINTVTVTSTKTVNITVDCGGTVFTITGVTLLKG